MANKKVNLTKAIIDKAELPEKGKRKYYYDSKEAGLILDITSTGKKNFYLYKKVDGKPQRIRIGEYPALSIENARKKALKLKAEINDGKNPNKEKKKLRDSISFDELFEKYINQYARPHKRNYLDDLDKKRLYLSALERKRADQISREDIKTLHESIAKNKNKFGNEKIYAANRTLALLSSVFNFGINNGLEIQNPCVGIKKYKEKSRDRFLQPDELSRFFEALEAEDNQTIKDYLYISLLTGARRSNILSMRWEEISFELREWRIPETKNGEPLNLPLVDEALELLKNRKKILPKDSEYVFPSNSKSGHLQDPKRAWKKLLERAEITNFRLHDLRRTMGSYQAISGANSYIIGKSLGHKTQQATAIYARLNNDPVRQSMSKAVSVMMGYKKD